MKTPWLYALLLAGSAAAYAQTAAEAGRLTFDGSVRLRYEIQDGYNDKKYGEDPTAGVGHDDFLLSRIRLGMNYRFSPDLMARVSIQDSRVAGWEYEDKDWYNSEFDMVHNPQNDPLELSQTYIRAANLGSMPLTATIGRQKIAYGDKRVFGPGEWKNSGKWVWDAAKLSYKKNGHFLDLFYGQTMLHDPDEFSLSHRHGYEGAGAYGHFAFRKSAAVEPMLIMKRNSDGNKLYDSLDQYYIGARIYDKNLAGFFYDGTYIVQKGTKTNLAGKELDVDALGYHLDAGYTLTPKFGKIKLGAGYSYASGEDAKTTDTVEKFDAVFGASDKYYGRMNMQGWSNLIDQELFADFKIKKSTKVKAEYHRFFMADKSDKWRKYTVAGNKETYIGDEFDVVAVYNQDKSFQYMAGLGYFMAKDYITENDIADNDGTWLFAQVTYTFKGE